jgi:hypothetical protein
MGKNMSGLNLDNSAPVKRKSSYKTSDSSASTYDPEKASVAIENKRMTEAEENQAFRKSVSDIASSKAPEGSSGSAESPMPGMKKGGKVSSASKRADGIAQRGKTKGRMV